MTERIGRFLLSLCMMPGDRVDRGAEWVVERGYDFCTCILEDARAENYCWKCFGFRAVPEGQGCQIELVSEMTRDEKLELGEEMIREQGYVRCDCVGRYGPDGTCKRCQGTGAVTE